MVINQKERWVFISPPKTASTTLTEVLTTQCGGVAREGRHAVRLPAECSDFLIFASVRNPYHRAQSLFRHRWLQLCRQQMDTKNPREALRGMKNPEELLTFADFIAQIHETDLAPFYTFTLSRWLQRVPHVDALIHVERLEYDVSALPFVKNALDIPRMNCTAGLTRLDCEYTHSTAAEVWRWADEDFIQYGYGIDL